MKVFTGGEFFHDGENIKLDFGIFDFWRWAYGNLLDNTKRGALAEYLIQKALALDTSGTQSDWEAFDITYKNNRIEVKSAAYIQAWNLNNDKYSDISFSIRQTYAWDEKTTSYNNVKLRNNDIYIFAVYEEHEKSKADISDISKWGFYVVLTKTIDNCFPGQKTITLNSLLCKIAPLRHSWHELKAAVDELIKTL